MPETILVSKDSQKPYRNIINKGQICTSIEGKNFENTWSFLIMFLGLKFAFVKLHDLCLM